MTKLGTNLKVRFSTTPALSDTIYIYVCRYVFLTFEFHWLRKWIFSKFTERISSKFYDHVKRTCARFGSKQINTVTYEDVG